MIRRAAIVVGGFGLLLVGGALLVPPGPGFPVRRPGSLGLGPAAADLLAEPAPLERQAAAAAGSRENPGLDEEGPHQGGPEEDEAIGERRLHDRFYRHEKALG